MSDVDGRSLEQREVAKIEDLEEFEWIKGRRFE